MQDKTDDPKKTSKPAYKPQIIESQQVSGEGKAEDANSRIASTAFINDVSQHAIPPPVKRSKLNRILWLLVLVSAVPIGLILGVFAFLTILASRGASGTELMALGLLPIIIVLPYVLPLSIIASLALLFRVKRSSQRIALIIFVATFGYMLVIASPLLMDNREFNKSLSIQETIKLINECKLSEVIIFVATFGYMLVIASPLLMDNREFNKSLSIQDNL